MGFGQSQQVTFGGQDLPEPVAERRAQIASLASLLGDDQDQHGWQVDLNPLLLQPWDGKYPEPGLAKPTEGDPLGGGESSTEDDQSRQRARRTSTERLVFKCSTPYRDPYGTEYPVRPPRPL